MKMEEPPTPRKPSPSAASPNLKIPASMELPSLSTAIAGISEPPTPSPVHYERLINSSHNISPSRPIYSDRFIPSRTGSNFSLFNIDSPPAAGVGGREESPSRTYVELLRAALFGPEFGPGTPGKDLGLGLDGRGFMPPPNRNIFRYKTETKRAIQSSSPFESNDSVPGVSYTPIKTPRKIARSPSKILDAPSLQDDYYLNLVDWSSNNVLAVGLANCVYLWNASSSKVTRLCDLGDDSVCSVGWAPRGANLAVGTSSGSVQIWDASNCKMIRSMEGHLLRTGSLSWSPSVLSSGSRDKKILQRDIRAPDDYVSKLTGHKSDVCGLKWSYDNRELASGGNDNRLFVWNQHSRQPAEVL